jgi:hypothetical protein
MKPTFKILAPVFTWLIAGLTLLQVSQSTTLAATSTLSDGNSTITFDPSSSAGVNTWSVNGSDQLNQDWFFVRVGSSGPVLSIDTIGAPTISQSTANSLDTTYANSSVSIRINYSLTGGSGGNSALAVGISIQNLTQNSLQFYNYGDFSLGGGMTSTAMGKNLGGLFNEADVSGANGGFLQTLVTPGANSGEAALGGVTLGKFAAGTALSGALNAGPAPDTTYAFGWNVAGGQSTTLSIISDLQAVPDHPDRLLTWIGLGSCLLMIRLVPKLQHRLARA